MEIIDDGKIVICMGSSCFARGNNKNLGVIEDFLKKHKLTAKVDVSGNLCEEKCSQGPNIVVNGVLYNRLEPNALLDILHRVYLKNK